MLMPSVTGDVSVPKHAPCTVALHASEDITSLWGPVDWAALNPAPSAASHCFTEPRNITHSVACNSLAVSHDMPSRPQVVWSLLKPSLGMTSSPAASQNPCKLQGQRLHIFFCNTPASGPSQLCLAPAALMPLKAVKSSGHKCWK